MRKSIAELLLNAYVSNETKYYRHQKQCGELIIYDEFGLEYKPTILGVDHTKKPIIKWEFKKNFDKDWMPLNNNKEVLKLNYYLSTIDQPL